MSVLLEALKKAALEKRNRGASDADVGVPAAEPSASGASSGAAVDGSLEHPAQAAAPKPVVNTAAADYLASKEARRSRPVIEQSEAPSALEPPATPEQSAAEEPAAREEPETAEEPEAFEAAPASATEPEPATPAPTAEPAARMHETEPLVDEFALPDHAHGEPEDFAVDGHEHTDEHSLHHHAEEDLDLDLDISAAAEFDSTVIEAPEAPELAADAAAASAAIDQAEQRRALQQLMGRSREVLKRSKRRGAYMYGALILTSLGAIGLYYWTLSQGDGLLGPEPAIVADLTLSEPVEAMQDSTGAGDMGETVIAQANADQGVPAAGEAAAEEPAPAAPDSLATPTAQPVVAEVTSGEPEMSLTRKPVALVDALRRAASPASEPAPAYQESDALVLIERRQTPRPLARKVNEAYRAYQAGDLKRASDLYRDVLAESPRQRDALLGAAAIAVQRGQYQEALRFYQRRLVDDSRDHFARAGLLALAGQGVANPELQSEVKLLLDDYPQQAHLHFLLGSLQAASGYWAEAQRSFFEARSWDRDNPDYAYNLAVSLEHLRQPRQALAQYRQALELAASTPPQFDTEVASRRVAYLESQQ